MPRKKKLTPAQEARLKAIRKAVKAAGLARTESAEAYRQRWVARTWRPRHPIEQARLDDQRERLDHVTQLMRRELRSEGDD